MKKKTLIFVLAMLGTLAYATVALAASSVTGDTIEYDFRNGQAIAKGNVIITNDDGRATAKDADYNTKTGEGKLTGSVVATKKDAKVTCHTLTIAQAGNHLTAIGNAVLKQQDKTLRADQVEYDSNRQYAETVGNWAQLALDDGSTMDSANMDYNMKDGIANAHGNVRIISPPRKLTARGDNAIYNTKLEDGTVELIGHATATQDGNTVNGDTLTLKGAGGKIAVAEGNVKLVYVPKPGPAAQPPLADFMGEGKYQEMNLYNWPGEKIQVASAEATTDIA
jgi:lipopolysaccharide export system protein LptA